MTIMAFLRARLAEDEAYGPRPLEPGEHYNEFDPGEPGYPPRVLREVAAKRALLRMHAVYSEPERWGSSHSDPAMRYQPTGGTTYWCEICDYDRDFGHIGSPQEGCDTLRHVAAVYSGHPDYRQEWKP